MQELIRQHLQSLQRHDLALLLSVSRVLICEVEIDDWLGDLTEEKVVVRAPKLVAQAIEALPPSDKKRIAKAAMACQPFAKVHESLKSVPLDEPTQGAVALLSELLIHRSMMISVATGGERIQDVNDYYIAREARIRSRLPDDILYDNPHEDLWAWYHHWREHFGSYAERRQYVRRLFQSAISEVATRPAFSEPQREPTGWERVDRTLAKARERLASASAEEDYQSIGLLCREVLISLAQAVFDPEIHDSDDGVKPSSTDANRMLEGYIAHAFPGASYKEVRAHARASLALALNLQHRRTATQQLGSLCLEATSSTTAVIAIIARAPR
ncbi:hypothetical protein [Pseudopontixanthobacter vadosimaris]|uniref:hypothetical protein n=1 Tax=Pseudopontixanthobacter vadosimaris TaxID=2726450 RepID=UPI0014760953|nr:hypothetical protein [Pseudopontixanthobacter vadosimaris]